MRRASAVRRLLWVFFLLAGSAVRAGEGPCDSTILLSGRVERTACYQPFYASFEVPANTVCIEVEQSFRSLTRTRCNLDLGIFDQRGFAGDEAGFRGWSGGARRTFFVGREEATPGYLAGEIASGNWSVVQMLTTEGVDAEWTLKIKLTIERKRCRKPAIHAAAKRLTSRPGVYRIAPHVHTVHSDGKLSPAEVVALSHASGLDGVISTEHNTSSALRCWGEVQTSDFLVVNGLEVTYPDGHWNAIGIPPGFWVDFRIRASDSAAFLRSVDRVRAAGGLAVANHPYDIPFLHNVALMDGVEVWNDNWDDNDEKALRLWDRLLRAGHRPTALASTDFHRGTQIAAPHTQVRCRGLSAKAVLAAIRTGALSLHKSPMDSLSFEVETSRGKRIGMGESVSAGKARWVLFCTNREGVLRLVDQNGCYYQNPQPEGQTLRTPLGRGSKWIRAELREADGRMIALTNPIYINE